jgi:hypothetical protein
MALQLSLTELNLSGVAPDSDPPLTLTLNTGTPHPESYWEISDFTVSLLHDETDTAITFVVFEGWHNKAAHDAGDKPFLGKLYELPPGAIDFEQSIGDGFTGMYAYALATPEPDTGVSFFDGATTV